MKKHVVMFSGGKDSTAMLLRMIAEKKPIDDIVMADLGVEFDEMYRHVKKIEKFIGRKIEVVKPVKPFGEYLLHHFKRKGKRITETKLIRDIFVNTEIGYSFPDMRNRWCTAIKKSIIKKHLKTKYRKDEIIEYHGIASDEVKRTSKNQDGREIKYPLIEWGMTEKDALEYCYDKGFRWDGLYEKFKRVSCWCCPLKSIAELEVLFRDYPEKWETLKFWESATYRTFRPKITLDVFEERFSQGGLF